MNRPYNVNLNLLDKPELLMFLGMYIPYSYDVLNYEEDIWYNYFTFLNDF